MKILALSGSTRSGSLSTALGRLVVDVRATDEVRLVTWLGAVPFYDGDLEARTTPPPVAELRSAVAGSDVLVLVTPEYNGSVPGVLKNAVDWLSRPHRASVLEGKPTLVLSASPSPFGGVRAAEHLRAVLGYAGASPIPDGLSLARAHERFADDGSADEQLRAELRDLLHRALDGALAPNPLSADVTAAA